MTTRKNTGLLIINAGYIGDGKITDDELEKMIPSEYEQKQVSKEKEIADDSFEILPIPRYY